MLAAEDSLSLWADGSQGAVGWERGVSHLVAPVGHSGESCAFFFSEKLVTFNRFLKMCSGVSHAASMLGSENAS